MVTKKYVGLSLSFCIKNILDGDVKIEDVFCIVTNTGFSSIDGVIENYCKDYWRDYPKDKVKELLEKLWPIIYQPRLVEEDSMCLVAHGWWLDTATGKLGLTKKEEENTELS